MPLLQAQTTCPSVWKERGNHRPQKGHSLFKQVTGMCHHQPVYLPVCCYNVISWPLSSALSYKVDRISIGCLVTFCKYFRLKNSIFQNVDLLLAFSFVMDHRMKAPGSIWKQHQIIRRKNKIFTFSFLNMCQQKFLKISSYLLCLLSGIGQAVEASLLAALFWGD